MFRIANSSDVQFIYECETKVFDKSVRMSIRSIKNSINSPHQRVIILENSDNQSVGCMILFIYKFKVRLYSIAILPLFQKNGYGKMMMKYLVEYADKEQKDCILEVRSDKVHLIEFYKSFGFNVIKELPNYYLDTNGLRMKKKAKITSQQNIVVVEQEYEWLKGIKNIKVVFAHEYINSPIYQTHLWKVFNLCTSYKYQSIGYYVSLLAVARNQYVTPSLTTIKDVSNTSIIRSITDDIDEIIQNECSQLFMQKFSIRIYFGHTLDKRFEKLSSALFELFELPFLEVELVKFNKWLVSKAFSFSISQADGVSKSKLSKWASSFFQKKHLSYAIKTYDYNLAILVNPNESTPPSDKKALELFKKAGEEIGFYVEFITKNDYRSLLEFDALFIRETTDVNNYTYDFARYAYSEGIVVIDDPWSILKCSNKVFLFELMQKQNLPIPKTKIMTKNNKSFSEFQNLEYPLILKQPDSAFSKGVFKVDNYKDLIQKAKTLLKKSEMIIVQEFLHSDYDWRIGVLNHKAIYACKYYMVQGDWKIISYVNDLEIDGEHETIPIEQVPKEIIQLSEKAASLIGDGLYGLDIKEFQGEYKIIEINDNPSIDYGVEDSVLGYDLYKIIMNDLYRRIDLERNQIKIIR